MAIKKFPSFGEAALAGFTIDLGNGEYAEGGETISRDRYPGLCSPLGVPDNGKEFVVPDYRGKFPKNADG